MARGARPGQLRYTGAVFYGFLMVVGVLGVALYVFLVMREVPGAAEERLGTYEPLPETINKWQLDTDSAQAKEALARGEQREVRLYFVESKPRQLLRQARYRNVQTGEISHADPDETMKRKRIRR